MIMRRCLALVVVSAAVLGMNCPLKAAMFSPGNLVVYRINPENANAKAVFIDEYTPSGTLVQTINMPTTASGSQRALTGAGSEVSSGFIHLSADSRYITVTGYNASVDTLNVSTTSSGAAGINRVVGRIDGFGNVDTSTAYQAYSGIAIRNAVTTDGTNIWATGGGPTSQGVRYQTFGTNNNNGIQTSTTASITPRVIEVYNNQLYTTSNSSGGAGPGLYAVGTGTPTNTGNALTKVLDSPNAYGFFLADLSSTVAGLDTAYIADESAFASGGGIRKYSFDGTTWTFENNIGAAGDTYRGLTGVATDDGVVLYATKQAGTDPGIYRLLDTAAFDAPNNGTLSLVATPDAGFIFRGIDFAPIVVPEPGAVLFGCIACGLVGLAAIRRALMA